jgi:hypothetical protein
VISILILLTLANYSSGQTVTRYDGEYATDLTFFEYELSRVNDPNGWLKFYWGFNTTGDSIQFEIGTSVLSEDYIDVYYDGVYKIPMDIYTNNKELDVNANATFFDYWQEIFWGSLLLPIEDGQYNVFDVLEDQDPASYDVKGDEVSFFTSESEWVYDYNTGVAKEWTNTITYDYTLLYVAPLINTSSEISSDDDGNFMERLPISVSTLFVGLISLIFVRKFRR